MFIFYPDVLATKTKLKTTIRNFFPPPILHAYTDLELFFEANLMVFKQQKFHFKPVSLLRVHYQVASVNAESGFCSVCVCVCVCVCVVCPESIQPCAMKNRDIY